MAKVSSRCLHYFPVAMLVSLGGTLTWLLHTGLCKFVQNILTNIWSLGTRTDLKLGEVCYLFFFYNCWRALARQHPFLYNGEKKAKSVGCKIEDMRSRLCFCYIRAFRGACDLWLVITRYHYEVVVLMACHATNKRSRKTFTG